MDDASEYRFKAVERGIGSLEKLYDSQHQSLAELRATAGQNVTAIRVLDSQSEERHEAFMEFKENITKALKELGRKMETEMKWIRRGAWALAATFLTFSILLAALIVNISHG